MRQTAAPGASLKTFLTVARSNRVLTDTYACGKL